jgi:hypothetical protein
MMKSQPDCRGLARLAIALSLLAAPGWLLPLHAGEQSKDAALRPYKARYQASYRGISGGEIENGLRRGTAPGEWIYESRAYPNLLGSVAVSSKARERGVMQVTAEGVRPLGFEFDDGTDAAKDVRITYDWPAGRARGTTRGEPFEIELQPGTQDTASVQAAMMVELLAGRSPQGFSIIARGRLRQYRYWSEAGARIATPYGEFDTVVWANQRDGSDRLTRVWHAPSLGYVPVQAVQYRKGKVESRLSLVHLER